MPSRNFILIVGLALFLVWYVSDWAYRSLYLAPRKQLGDEIKKLADEIKAGRNDCDTKTQFNAYYQGYYARSLPASRNDAQQYSLWLLELLLYTGFEIENTHVNPSSSPVLIPFGASYQFNVQCTGSFSQLSYFLFEFYYAPFLHRITSMTLSPTEGNTEQLTFVMAINVLALDTRPYQPTNQMPTGYISRLASNDLATYKVIANRNLLQTAKGGIDRADYTFLTGMPEFGNQKEVWFSVRTDDSVIKKKLGEPIQSGSFSGRLVEILDHDIVLERNGERWLLTTGESLNQAFALPPETFGKSEE